MERVNNPRVFVINYKMLSERILYETLRLCKYQILVEIAPHRQKNIGMKREARKLAAAFMLS